MRHARRTLLLLLWLLWIPLAATCAPEARDLSATQLTAAQGVGGKVLAFEASGRMFGASSLALPAGNDVSAAVFAPDGRVWAASPAFIGRLNAGGNAWDWYIEQKVDEINGIAADAGGAVYEVGRRGGNVWIAKFDASGPSPVLAWEKTFGGAGNGAANAVATDSGTGVYLTGWSESQDWNAPDSHATARTAGRHAFVLKLDAADGSPQYRNWLPDGADAEGLGIAVMRDLSAVVTGRTGLGSFSSTSGFAGDTCGPNSAFLARVSPAGDSLLYSGCLSGDGQQEGRAVALDTHGNAWVAGSTTSLRFAGEESLPGTRRPWIARVSADGNSLEFVKGMAAMAPGGIDIIAAEPAGDGAVAAGTGEGAAGTGEGAARKSLLLRVGPSTNSAGTIQVARKPPVPPSQAITFDAIHDRIFGISPFRIAAHSSALAPIGYTVSTPAVCRVSDDLVTLLSAGTCSITASSAATSVLQSFTVTRARASATFAEAKGSPFRVGKEPASVVAGYFNEDSIPDLATRNEGSGNVTVLLGTGTGAFAPAISGDSSTVKTSPESQAAGDFNGDGIEDLATANLDGNSVTVLLGNGSGGFAPAPGSPFAVGTSPASVLVADFNGDGIPDLATANYGSNNVTILLGNGLGGFAPARDSPFMVGTAPRSLTVADFNGDGIEDLAVANARGGNVTVLLGSIGTEQTITFGPLSGVTYGVPPFAVSATSSSGLTVSFASTTPTVCTVVLTMVTIVGAGSCSIVASQLGDATYAAAPTVTQSFTVNMSGQTISFGPLVNQTIGAAIAHAAILSWIASTTPKVTYDVFRATASTGPFTTPLNVSPITGTTYIDTSVQAGQTYYYVVTAVASNGTQSADSNEAEATIPLLLTPTATASSGLPVTLVPNTPSVCTLAGATVTLVGPGTCSITASQPGDPNWAAATPITSVFTVYAPPAIVSLSPSAGAGTSVTLQAVYTDPQGVSDLSTLLLQINSIQSSANACYVYYQPQGNHLYLAGDTGVWMTPALTPGAAGTVSNSQCTLNSASSSVTAAGNNLTLTVALSFNSSFTISRNVYLYAAGLIGLNSGWVQAGTWTPNPIAAPPAIVGLSPDAGAGASVTLQAVYTDPNGAGDLNTLLMQINSIQTSANACYVYYKPQGNLLYLSSNAGTAWMTPALTPGVAGTASNGQCTLNAASSKVTMAGNNLTLTVALTFNSSFVSFRSVYLYAAGFSGFNSGWVKDGTWTPNPVAEPPAVVSLSPSSGAGASVTFQAVYTDPNGAGDLNTLLLQINSTQSSGNACYVYYQPQANLFYLATNAGAWITPGLTPGVAGTVSNSQCALNAASSKVTTAGNNITLTLALSFNTGFVTSRNVYLYAAGFSGLNSGWVEDGTWTPNPIAEPPAIVSLSPSSGTGASVTFQAVYTDPNGAGDLETLLLQVNSIQTGANACYVYYQPQGNHLYLANNAGIWITPALTPGVAGTVSNTQCTLDAGSSKVTMAGNNLTLSVALSFSGVTAGSQNVYLYAAGFSGETSGWVREGAWTP